MTTASATRDVLAPTFTTRPESCIVKAARGHTISDWPLAQDEFNARLVAIITSWPVKEVEIVGTDGSPEVPSPDPSFYTSQIKAFPAPPHTVQRLAELLDDPLAWYRSLHKFLRALIRVLSVTSTTIDYSQEKQASNLAHEDSLLVPIPWLTTESMTGSAHIIQDNDDKNVPRTVTTTTMSNGVKITMNGLIDNHDGSIDPSEGHSSLMNATAPVSGTAPIDAADYGPQTQSVKEAIAMNGSASTTTETAREVGNGDENGDHAMDES